MSQHHRFDVPAGGPPLTSAPPQVSVALCTFNGERHLQEQLDSIVGQSLLPDELVVCDDGSTDATPQIVAGFACDAPFPVRFVRNSRNLGSTRNFEQAIRLCQGSLIALCDQDDWWHPRKLEILTAALQQSGAGGAFSDGYVMNEDSQLTGGTLWEACRFSETESGMGEIPDRELAVFALLRTNMVTGATLLFRSALRNLCLPFSDRWVHDGWLAWMIVLHSRLLACKERLIRYRVHFSQQVGLPGRSILARLRRAQQTGARDYRAVEGQFSALLDYAASHADVCSPDLCRRIDEKRRHAAFRAELNPARWPRWRQIALRRSDYRLYAQGWHSMLKDALR